MKTRKGNTTKDDDSALKLLAENKLFTLNRVKTFSKWPFKTGTCSAQKMAEAGFFHSGQGSAKCYFCDKELDGWEKEDVPMLEHKKRSQLCPYVLAVGENYRKLAVRDLLNLELQSITFKLDKWFNESVVADLEAH